MMGKKKGSGQLTMNRSKQGSGMGKKVIIVLLVSWALASVHPTHAQQPKKVPRIGYLGEADPALTDAFRQGLHENGYVEGKNIIIEYRNRERGKIQLVELASDLVHLNVDVIVTGGGATYAVRDTTKSIPIVFVNVGEPVGAGL